MGLWDDRPSERATDLASGGAAFDISPDRAYYVRTEHASAVQACLRRRLRRRQER